MASFRSAAIAPSGLEVVRGDGLIVIGVGDDHLRKGAP